MPSIFDLQEPLSAFTAVSTKSVAGTLTATETIASLILSVPTSGVTLNTPTAAALIAELKSPQVGTSFDLAIRNTAGSALAVTLAGGSGVTVVGTATTAQNIASIFRAVVTGVSTPAITFYRVGTGAV